jgi:catechol 2,3-dioxygenase-like lactoylglutathione lyase family enzyme
VKGTKASGRAKMLGSAKIVGFVPTSDYDKARAFYEGKLEFEFVSIDQYALVMSVGGHRIRIAKIPNFAPLQGTILGWEVTDIEAVVTWLRDRGVALEKYPFVQDRELGIWTTPTDDKVAWFKDPDGNILSVVQHHQSTSKVSTASGASESLTSNPTTCPKP